MRILFLVPYPTGEAPSQRFRFEQYFGLLQEENIEFTVSSFWGLRAWSILYKRGHWIEKIAWLLIGFAKREVDLWRSFRYDLVFIHRECAPIGPPIFEYILAKTFRKKIIYDFDDAIWMDNTSDENKLARWVKFHGKVKSICHWSYRVSCGNEWLANYARQFNRSVTVNPTTINTENHHTIASYTSIQKDERIIIGWTGTHSTVGYLNSILPVIQSLEKKFSMVVRIISNKDPQIPLASIEFVPWKKETEIQDLRSFDIGIMPLPDDEWAKGKCGFKALQYMSLGIPSVVSAVGVNTAIIEQGTNGYLCTSLSEWQANLESLILDKALRAEMGGKARAMVIEKFSVQSNTGNFLSLFN